MSTPIIATKLFVPPLRPGLIARARLNDRFLAGLHCKATLVSAPAGFGKTTLVTAGAAHCGRAVAWLSLEAADSDYSRFLCYLVAAIGRVSPGFGEGLLVSLNAQQQPPAEILLTALINDLAMLEEPLLLVLDDYHLVDDAAVDSALGFILEHAPPQLHCVITTREDPQLPLAAWRAKGLLGELRAADLRFSADEASGFLNQTMGLGLSAEDVAALEARTEGWIAGLQLAALSLQGCTDRADFIRAFTGSNRFVLDYLAEEVLSRQDEQVREFMLQTAVLDRLCGPLCDAVTGQHGGAERLQGFERDNLFVVPLDDQRRWYRYHHMFRDVLRARLMQQRAEILPELHRRASQWFANNDQYSEAVQHLLAAEDYPAAAELVESALPEMRATLPEVVFNAWMAQLPADQLSRRPVLCAHYGFKLISMDFERGKAYFDLAERSLALLAESGEQAEVLVSNPEALSELPGMLALGRAYQAGAEGDLEGIVAHCQRALALLDEDAAVWRGGAAVMQGLVYWAQGELESAHVAILEGHNGMVIGGDTSGAISTLYLLANLRLGQGRLDEAAAHCAQGQELLRGHAGAAPQGLADLYVVLAAIAAEQHRLADALALLQEAKAMGEHAVLLESRHLWHVVLATVESRQGKYAEAITALDEAARRQLPSPAPNPMPVEAWRAKVQLLAGNLDAVTAWAGVLGVSPEDDLSYLREFEYAVLARLLFARYRKTKEPDCLEQARALSTRLLAVANSGGRQQRALECLLIMAMVHRAAGDDTAAREALRSALVLAEPQNMVGAFLDEGEPIRQMLKVAAKGRDASAYAQHLLTCFGGARAAAPSADQHGDSLAEPLSEREFDVLRLFASELSGPEIADRLFVSLNTLRTHSKNIYAKLGVNSRRAALKRADELGLR